jgi:hypothetical protein
MTHTHTHTHTHTQRQFAASGSKQTICISNITWTNFGTPNVKDMHNQCCQHTELQYKVLWSQNYKTNFQPEHILSKIINLQQRPNAPPVSDSRCGEKLGQKKSRIQTSLESWHLLLLHVVQIREDEISGKCGTNEEVRNLYKILVENLEGRRPLRGLWVDGKITLKWMLNT